MSMSQGEAVFQAVVKVVGEVNGKVDLTDAQEKEVREHVLQMFLSGETSHKSNPSEEQLRKYIPGLVNNWLRKDKRMNGGVKYETKRPGSRAGSGDETLKAMRALLSTTTDPEAKEQIEAAIAARLAEIKPAKKIVNIDALPEGLRKFVTG